MKGSWEKMLVSQLADIVTGTTPSPNDAGNYGGDIPFVTPGDLGENKYIRAAEKNLTPKGALNAKILPPGSTLFTCIGATIGKVGLAAVPLSTNQQINGVVPKSDIVDPEFLFYALSAIAPQVKRIAGAQAVPIVNKSELSSQKVLVPCDICEQKAIADLLSAWDEAIEKTERLIQAKEKLHFWLRYRLIDSREARQHWQTTELGWVAPRIFCTPIWS